MTATNTSFIGVRFLSGSHRFCLKTQLQGTKQDVRQLAVSLPPGLPNVSGNVCFLNALLQALAAFPSLISLLTVLSEHLHVQKIPTTDTSDAKASPHIVESLLRILHYLNRIDHPYGTVVVNSVVQPSPSLRSAIDTERLREDFNVLKQYYERLYSRLGHHHHHRVRLHNVGEQDFHEVLHFILEHIRFVAIPTVKGMLRRPLVALLQQHLTPSLHDVKKPWWRATSRKEKWDLFGDSCDACAYLTKSKRVARYMEQCIDVVAGQVEHIIECVNCKWKNVTPSSSLDRPNTFLMMELSMPPPTSNPSLSQLRLHDLLFTQYGSPSVIDDVQCPSCALENLGCTLNSDDNAVGGISRRYVEEARQRLLSGEPWETILATSQPLASQLKGVQIARSKKLYFSNLISLPICLSIHLQRNCLMYGYVNKNSTYIEFPLILDLGSFARRELRFTNSKTMLRSQESEQSWVYELQAVVEHIGNVCSSGHFVTYRRWDNENTPPVDGLMPSHFSEQQESLLCKCPVHLSGSTNDTTENENSYPAPPAVRTLVDPFPNVHTPQGSSVGSYSHGRLSCLRSTTSFDQTPSSSSESSRSLSDGYVGVDSSPFHHSLTSSNVHLSSIAKNSAPATYNADVELDLRRQVLPQSQTCPSQQALNPQLKSSIFPCKRGVSPDTSRWRWVCISDDFVRLVPTSYVLSRQAYTLHYQRLYAI